MKRNLLSVLTASLLLLATSACTQMQKVSESQNYITKNMKAENFTGIKLMGSPDVIYTQTNGAPKIQIYGSDNIIELLETYVEDGTLVVKFRNNTLIQYKGKLEVRVSSPHLNQIIVQGSGDVLLAHGLNEKGDVDMTIQGSGDINGESIRCNHLSIGIQGSGDVQLRNIVSTYTKANIAGSGDMTLVGESKEAEYDIAGSGDISASELEAAKVSARIAGSGGISCHATESLHAKVTGSGEIGYKGNPQQVETSRKGVYKL